MVTILAGYINRASGSKFRRVVAGIQAALADGILKPGDRLPPQRELADALRVTLGTITRGYHEASELGLIRGEIGRGTFIAPAEPNEFALHRLHNLHNRDFAGVIRFDLNFPVPDGDPDLAAMLTDLRHSPNLPELLLYQPTAGMMCHRQAACRWLERFSVHLPPERVAITTGAQHALFAALASLLAPGDALAVDPYTYPGIINLAEVLHIRLIAIDWDEEGMRPDLLERAAHQQRLKGVYLIPTLHNPTTRTMPMERRRELAATVRAADLFLLEDDVYGGMEREKQLPVATLIPERGYYLSNLSKSLAPGLRLGFLAVPAGKMPAVEKVMATSIWLNPPLMAEIGSRWIDDGTAERTIVTKRKATERRFALLSRILPQESLQYRPGSLHAWLTLSPPWTGEAFARLAAARGVQVIPSGNFSSQARQTEEAVRICIGPPANDAEVERGAAILANILSAPPSREAMII